MNPILRRGLLLAAIGTALPAFDSLREDDLACEEITLEISDCCPDVDPERFQCDFDDGCGTPTTLTRGEIECLQTLSCDEMRDEGSAERFSPAAEHGSTEEEATRCIH